MTDQIFNAPVVQGGYDQWATPIPNPLQSKFWEARWCKLLGLDVIKPHGLSDTVVAATTNPYYAVVCATAFTLQAGYFRGYEHFRNVYFKDDSRHYIGVTVHKERTRTHMDEGRYVTDWYVAVNDNMEINLHEQLFRGAVGIMVSAAFPNGMNLQERLVRFVTQNTLNIRVKDDGDQKAQISSQG